MTKNILKVMFFIIMTFGIMFLNAENVVKNKIVSAKVVGDSIIATYVIPKGMHQTKQEDFFYLDVNEVKGITFGETKYPEGHADEDGYINYEGTVKLIKKFKVDKAKIKKDAKIKVLAGYQLCFPTYCEEPVEVEFDLIIKRE